MRQQIQQSIIFAAAIKSLSDALLQIGLLAALEGNLLLSKVRLVSVPGPRDKAPNSKLRAWRAALEEGAAAILYQNSTQTQCRDPRLLRQNSRQQDLIKSFAKNTSALPSKLFKSLNLNVQRDHQEELLPKHGWVNLNISKGVRGCLSVGLSVCYTFDSSSKTILFRPHMH